MHYEWHLTYLFSKIVIDFNINQYCKVIDGLHTKVNLDCNYRLQLHWLLLPPLPRASWVVEEEEVGFHQQNSRKRSASLVGARMGRIFCEQKRR